MGSGVKAWRRIDAGLAVAVIAVAAAVVVGAFALTARNLYPLCTGISPFHCICLRCPGSPDSSQVHSTVARCA